MNTPDLLDPWIGRSIGDRQRYRLENRLGAGGMGDVFLAMDTLLGQQVALKLLKDTLVAAEEPRKRFEREVALSAALKSDHIVGVSDCGVTPDGHPFYVMEYLRGETLGQLLRREQRVSVERTLGIITQVCEGLQLAHEGIPLWRDGAMASELVLVIHRDMKPDNIFLVPTALGELVKILDFGIAKIRNEFTEHTNLTGMFIGTFHYAAPEQFGFANDLDGRADIYSLGIILYEMLSGTDPFGLGFNLREISAMSWLAAHVSKPPMPLRSQPGCEQLSPELEAVVMRCLQKVPDERFASVDELKRALLAAAVTMQQLQHSGLREEINNSISPQVPQGYEQKLQQNEQENTTNIHQQYPFNQRIFNPSEKITDSTETTETYNLKPIPPGEGKAGENKKKIQRLLLKATVVATAFVSVSLGYYAHIQAQAEQSTKEVLKNINVFKEGKNYEECVNQAKVVPQKSRFYADAQNLLNECQLEEAKELAKQNKFKDAITAANKIQLNSSFHSSAQQFIISWSENLLKQAEEQYKKSYNSKDLENAINITEAIPTSSSVAKKAEEAIGKWRSEWNNNENYLQAAQKAFKEGKWPDAISKANQVRLLGQEVKRDTSYWQNKMKSIIEEAEKRIAASKSGTTRTVQYSAPRPKVRYSAPRPKVRYSAPRPKVRYSAPRPKVRYSAPRRTGWARETR